MPRGYEYADDLKKKVLDEVLKGVRRIREVADENQVTPTAVRDWLKGHYADNPEDPRRHMVERESARYRRVSDGAGETVLIDVAAKRNLKKHDLQVAAAKRKDPEFQALKAKVLEALRNRQPNETILSIAERFGVKEATANTWATKLRKKAKLSEHGQRVRDGMLRRKREREQAQQSEQFQLQNPPASALAPVSRTMVSSRSPSRPAALLPPPSNGYDGRAMAVGVSVSFDEASQTTLKAALEERSTLRGMVDILQRENEDLKRRLEAAYRRG